MLQKILKTLQEKLSKVKYKEKYSQKLRAQWPGGQYQVVCIYAIQVPGEEVGERESEKWICRNKEKLELNF